jgi:hypothetical protein
MKTIHGYKNTGCFEHLVFLLIVLCLAMTACKLDEPCKLTAEDKRYLYNEGDTITFLESGKDTIDIIARTTYGVFDESSKGIPDFNKQEIGGSTIIILNNKFEIGIGKRACSDYIRLSLYCAECKNYQFSFSEHIRVDSVYHEPIKILGQTYIDYFMVSESSSLRTLKNYTVNKTLVCLN